MMKAGPAPADPAAYVDALAGWQRERVTGLRTAVLPAGADEVIKWGNLVYLANGPAFMIRAEEARVLFGFWRGQRLREIEPRLKPGGKYEMATMEIVENTNLDLEVASKLALTAVELNATLGDPTKL